MAQHLISILIPTYNAPEYFRIALESARAQTYAPIEIIVCDNSTDDRTERLMQSYADDARIRYVRNRTAKTKEENFAPFEQLVRGDYIQWLMHDDVLKPEKLAKMAAILDTHPEVTLVSSQRDIIDASGQPLASHLRAHRAIAGEYEIFPGEEQGNMLLRSVGNYIGEPSAVLFRRRDLAHPYYHAESRGYKRLSDVAMWLELMEKGDLCLFREPLSSYRRHDDQEGQQPDVVLESRCEWLRLMQEYWQRRVFLHTRKEYEACLRTLLQDARNLDADGYLRQQAISPTMRRRYDAALQSIVQELGEPPFVFRTYICSCLIYRDEAERLPEWLSKAAVYSDELVLVDTGSTDGSAELVQQFADTAKQTVKLLHFPWHDDFAAARNAALEVADGDWVIFLDADETFRQPQAVRGALTALPREVAGVQVPVVNVDADARDAEISRFPALRIWRPTPARRYRGRIHEALYEAGRPLGNVRQLPELAVRHTGYSTRRLQAKLQRNKALLEREQQAGDVPPEQLYRYLADCCYGLGEYQAALDYAVRAIEQEPPTVAGKQGLYVLVLAAMRALKLPQNEQLAFAEAAWREHPDWLDIGAHYGLLAAACGETDVAKARLQEFLQAASALQQGRAEAGQAMQDTQAYALCPRVLRTLGGLALQEGKAAEAEPYLRQALRLSRYDEQALSLWAACCERQGKDVPASLAQEGFYPPATENQAFLRGWVIHTGQAACYRQLAPDLVPVRYEQAVQKGAGEMKILFRALFAGGRELQRANRQLFQANAAMLPACLQRLLAVGLGQADADSLTAADADAYQAGLNAMLGCQKREALKRYLSLAGQFGWPMVRQVADALCDAEEWSLAWSLYEQIPEAEMGEAAAFWYHAGLCLYHLHASAAAACFDRAEQAGCSSPDIRAYRQWMQDWAKEAQG